MTISEIFEKCLRAGIKGDSRDISEDINLEDLKKKYGDSAIHYDNKKEIKKVFVGIDTECQEILLADRIGVDGVIGHHPEGSALVNLWKVMEIHQEAVINCGVPVSAAERMVEERQEEIKKSFHGSNYNRACDSAKLLNIPFINVHTPADNLANLFMDNFIKNSNIKTLKELCDKVLLIPEYAEASKYGVIPKIVSGSDKHRIGNYFVKFNGGTSGNKKLFKYLENLGISTFICMHLPENQIEEAKKCNINIVIMPHMASDSLGVNLMLDTIENIEIISGAGFTRVSRRQ